MQCSLLPASLHIHRRWPSNTAVQRDPVAHHRFPGGPRFPRSPSERRPAAPVRGDEDALRAHGRHLAEGLGGHLPILQATYRGGGPVRVMEGDSGGTKRGGDVLFPLQWSGFEGISSSRYTWRIRGVHGDIVALGDVPASSLHDLSTELERPSQ